jgi:chromosome segregation ATPase
VLRDQKSELATQVSNLKKNLEKLEIELSEANEQSIRVIHELDNQKVENAGLRKESLVLREKSTSLEHQIEKLRKKLDRLSTGKAQTQQIVAVKDPEATDGFSQTVIQWVRQDAAQIFERRISPKKIGRWNAQRSKDGYYRLYRKIGGRVYSIYVGKELDINKAQSRIADKEKKLLILNPATSGADSSHGKRQMKLETSLRTVEAPAT